MTHCPASRCYLLKPEFPDDADELLFLAPGVIKDVALLKSLFELFATMLDQLCRIRVTTRREVSL